MAPRGKFIVIEGIDGSGKRTQMEMLARALTEHGVEFTELSFPRYGGFFGDMVAQFLNGEFGSLETVDPHFSALLYAGDRLDAKPVIEGALEVGHTVLADRYIGSNLAHQGARVPRARRREFLAWLKKLEYEVYALPAEDLVIYLRLPAGEAHRMVGKKAARKYTTRRRDILEASIAHLKIASEVYDQLAKQRNWVTIECAAKEPERVRGRRAAAKVAGVALRSPEAIHRDIMAAIKERALAEARAS